MTVINAIRYKTVSESMGMRELVFILGQQYLKNLPNSADAELCDPTQTLTNHAAGNHKQPANNSFNNCSYPSYFYQALLGEVMCSLRHEGEFLRNADKQSLSSIVLLEEVVGQLSESQAEGKLTSAHSPSCPCLWEDIDVPWEKETKQRREKK